MLQNHLPAVSGLVLPDVPGRDREAVPLRFILSPVAGGLSADDDFIATDDSSRNFDLIPCKLRRVIFIKEQWKLFIHADFHYGLRPRHTNNRQNTDICRTTYWYMYAYVVSFV